jgi:hypothetical protein
MHRLVIAFCLALAAASPALAQGVPAELDAYTVSEENRFQQVRLTPEILDRLLAAMPDVLTAQNDMGAAIVKLNSASSSRWDQAVERTRIIQGAERKMQDAALAKGFANAGEFFQTLTTLQMVLLRADLRKTTTHQLRLAEFAKNAGFAERMMIGTALRNAELAISAAQQQPLPENVTVAEPYRQRFMETMTRIVHR